MKCQTDDRSMALSAVLSKLLLDGNVVVAWGLEYLVYLRCKQLENYTTPIHSSIVT